MTSSIVTSGNETFMGKNPSSHSRLKPKPISNTNPNSGGQRTQKQSRTCSEVSPSVPEDAASYNRQPTESSRNGQLNLGEYKSVDFTTYSRSELKKLKRSFVEELDQIRSYNDRIPFSQFKASSPTIPSKKSGGIKRPLPGSEISNADQKRQAAKNAPLLKRCGQILAKLMKHKQAWIFNSPVDADGMGLHDYFQIVKNPMDLGTVKSKMGKGMYSTPMEFVADVRLTFKNALMYNPKGHDVYLIAEQLLAYFEGMFKSLSEKNEEEQMQQQQQQPEHQKFGRVNEMPEFSWISSRPVKAPEKGKRVNENAVKKLELPPQTSPVASNLISRPPTLVQSPVPTPPKRASPVKSATKKKQPKPKAKDPNKREMSMEEKHMLGVALQSLPEEKMAQVVQIIKKRNGNLTEVGDEIELDIEAVDKETLWELDRFVTYWKKMVSKIRRQALLENNINGTTSESKMALEDDNGVSSGSKRRSGECREGDEDADIEDDEVLTASILPLQIDKDDDECPGKAHCGFSGSSSSSSESSSSSDSDSSSGSDSDADNAQSRQLPKT